MRVLAACALPDLIKVPHKVRILHYYLIANPLMADTVWDAIF
jgi:hypothetical protein